MPSYHPFLSLAPSMKSKGGPQYCHTRDVHPLMEVTAVLQEQGYRVGRTLLNHPPTENDPPGSVSQIDTSRVASDDLIVTATRPPRHDHEYDDPKPLRRAFTDLEERIFRSWALCLDRLARSTVWLAEPARELIRPGYETHRQLAFFVRGPAYIKETNDLVKGGWKAAPRKARSAAYVLRQRELWSGGPGYLGFFGMDTRFTLVWASMLRDQFPDFVREPGFAVVEISEGPTPNRPTDIAFHSGWKAEVVVHQPL